MSAFAAFDGKEDPADTPTGEAFSNFALGFVEPKTPQKSILSQSDGL